MFALLCFVGRCPKHVPRVPDSSRVAEDVVRVLAKNPSAVTLRGMNTYLVSRGMSRFLIDSGDGRRKEFAAILKRTMREGGCERLSGILVTYWYPDHCGGIELVRETLNDRTIKAYKMVRKTKDEVSAVEEEEGGGGKQKFRHYVDMCDVFKCEGAMLREMHTPGH